ncbi:unnamed protein product, partial [Staurois parvus]
AKAEKEDYKDYVLCSDETKINVFGTDSFKTVWHRIGEEYKERCMVPTVKLGGGSILSVCPYECCWCRGAAFH